MYDVEESVQNLSLLEDLLTQFYKEIKRTVLAASLDKLITRDLGRSIPPPPPPHCRG